MPYFNQQLIAALQNSGFRLELTKLSLYEELLQQGLIDPERLEISILQRLMLNLLKDTTHITMETIKTTSKFAEFIDMAKQKFLLPIYMQLFPSEATAEHLTLIKTLTSSLLEYDKYVIQTYLIILLHQDVNVIEQEELEDKIGATLSQSNPLDISRLKSQLAHSSVAAEVIDEIPDILHNIISGLVSSALEYEDKPYNRKIDLLLTLKPNDSELLPLVIDSLLKLDKHLVDPRLIDTKNIMLKYLERWAEFIFPLLQYFEYNYPHLQEHIPELLALFTSDVSLTQHITVIPSILKPQILQQHMDFLAMHPNAMEYSKMLEVGFLPKDITCIKNHLSSFIQSLQQDFLAWTPKIQRKILGTAEKPSSLESEISQIYDLLATKMQQHFFSHPSGARTYTPYLTKEKRADFSLSTKGTIRSRSCPTIW